MAKRRSTVLSSKQEHREKLAADKQKVLHSTRTKYERYRHTVYTLLERPCTRREYLYHAVNCLLIVCSILLSIVSTVQYFADNLYFNYLIFYFEVGVAL